MDNTRSLTLASWVFSALFSVFAIGLGGCDVIQAPYRQEITPPVVVGDTVTRVLLEDFTGFLCGNCPDASKEAARLKKIYGDRLVVIKAHITDAFAKPTSKHPADYRTPIGNELETYFTILGLPTGMVNRSAYNNRVKLSVSTWASAVDSAIKAQPTVLINFKELNYNATNRIISCNIEVDYLEDGTEQDYLSVYVVEDSIIGFQKNYANQDIGLSVDVENYVHNEMLRGAMNGTWGDVVSGSTAPKKGNKFTKTYQFEVKPEWNEKQIKVIAFLHKNDTKVVRQVNEKKIIAS